MPNVTLRRGAQIVGAVKRRVDEINPPAPVDDTPPGYPRRRRRGATERVTPLSVKVEVDVDTVSAAQIEARAQLWRDQLERLFQLLQVQGRLLAGIAKANVEHGVQPLVVERVGLLRRQKVVQDCLTQLGDEVFEGAVFTAKVEAVRSRLKTAESQISVYGETPAARDRLTVAVLPLADRNDLREQAVLIARLLNAVDDNLVGLNTRHQVEIATGDWEFLQKEGIV